MNKLIIGGFLAFGMGVYFLNIEDTPTPKKEQIKQIVKKQSQPSKVKIVNLDKTLKKVSNQTRTITKKSNIKKIEQLQTKKSLNKLYKTNRPHAQYQGLQSSKQRQAIQKAYYKKMYQQRVAQKQQMIKRQQQQQKVIAARSIQQQRIQQQRMQQQNLRYKNMHQQNMQRNISKVKNLQG